MKTGSAAPDFCLQDDHEKTVCLNHFQGQWVVLYFYPKDNTSGCTLEAVDFSGALEQFQSLQTVVLGVSPDSVKSHCNFRDKHQLTLPLLSDPELNALKAYGVWALKKMVGREYYGVLRSTFIIGPDGKIRAQWKKVKVKGHVDAVLASLKELQQ